MKVGTSLNVISSRVNSRNLEESVQNGKNSKNRDGHKKITNSIYAGDLNANQDLIASRKVLGHKQAMKKILDSFSNELNLDGNIQEMRNQKDSLNADMNELKDKIRSLQGVKADIQKTYGVSEDSTEQKDLDILLKANNNTGKLTEEEQDRLKNMGPLTDYQKEMLEVSKMEANWSKKADSAKNEVANINRTIDAIGVERGKSHPVLDARKEAEDIMDAASKDIVGKLLDEAVEATDKKLEDNKKAEKDQKEKDAQAEKKAEETSATGTTTGTEEGSIESIAAKQEKVLHEIKKQALKDGLSMEDIKGILVDAQS